MSKQKIEFKDGKFMVEIKDDSGTFDYLMTSINGWQWAGIQINKPIAKMIIKAMNEYLGDNDEQ